MIDAAKVVRQEYREGSRQKRLTCRKFSVLTERDQGAVYVVDRLSENTGRKAPRELISLGLLERSTRGGENCLRVHFFVQARMKLVRAMLRAETAPRRSSHALE